MRGNGLPEATSLRTKLDTEVRIPWLETFELGQGFDAVTGHSRISPFRGIRSLKVVPDSDPPALKVNFEIVHGQHEASNKRRFHAQGTINTHTPLTLEASFANERERSNSKASFMVDHYASGKYHFETLNMDELRLTDKAQSLLQRSPRKFRDYYGDYFIVGYQRRFTFSALIECYTSNEQYTKQTEYDAKVALQNVLGGGVGHTKNVKNSNFRLSSTARISQSGCDFRITDSGSRHSVAIKDVIKMVGKMKNARPDGRKEIALLRHYSQLYNSLPDSAPVAPGIFDELHKLDSTAWELESSQSHPACDRHTVRMIKTALNTFTEGRSSFIADRASLKKSQNTLSRVKELLDDQLHRYDFIQKVVHASRSTPLVGSVVDATNPDQKWAYGFVAVTSRQRAPEPGEKYTSVTLHNGISAYEVVLETAPRLRSSNLYFSSSLALRTVLAQEVSLSRAVTVSGMQAYIVGWTLSCRTPTQVKKTFTIQSGGLTCSGLEIKVDPADRFRERTWRCRIYFVDQATYV